MKIGCFACGTTSGFRIFNVSPYSEIFRRSMSLFSSLSRYSGFASGGIGIIEMLYRCNIIALVGGGSCPRFPTNTVFLLLFKCWQSGYDLGWQQNEMHRGTQVQLRHSCCQITKRQVFFCRSHRDSHRIVVVLDSKISVYNLMDVKLLDTLCTSYNPNGTHPRWFSLFRHCCPLSKYQQLRASLPWRWDWTNKNYCMSIPHTPMSVQSTERQIPLVIQAHNTPLQCLALSSDGTRLASASEKVPIAPPPHFSSRAPSFASTTLLLARYLRN